MSDIILRRNGVILEGVYLAIHGDMLELKSDEHKDPNRQVNHQRFALHHNNEDELELNKANKYARVIIHSNERPLQLKGDVEIHGNLEVKGRVSPYLNDDNPNFSRFKNQLKLEIMEDIVDGIPELKKNKQFQIKFKQLKHTINVIDKKLK